MKILKIISFPLLVLALCLTLGCQQQDSALQDGKAAQNNKTIPPLGSRVKTHWRAYALEVNAETTKMAEPGKSVDILINSSVINKPVEPFVATILQNVYVLDVIKVQNKQYLLLSLISPIEAQHLALVAPQSAKVIMREAGNISIFPIAISKYSDITKGVKFSYDNPDYRLYPLAVSQAQYNAFQKGRLADIVINDEKPFTIENVKIAEKEQAGNRYVFHLQLQPEKAQYLYLAEYLRAQIDFRAI